MLLSTGHEMSGQLEKGKKKKKKLSKINRNKEEIHKTEGDSVCPGEESGTRTGSPVPPGPVRGALSRTRGEERGQAQKYSPQKKSKHLGTLGTGQDNRPLSLGIKRAVSLWTRRGWVRAESEIPATSGWLGVRRRVWAEQPFPVVRLSRVSGRVWTEGSPGLCARLCVTQRDVPVPELSLGFGKSTGGRSVGPDSGLGNVEAEPGLLGAGAACFDGCEQFTLCPLRSASFLPSLFPPKLKIEILQTYGLGLDSTQLPKASQAGVSPATMTHVPLF